MERPYGTQDKITAEAARRQAQLRAKRAAAVARRAAAARRRAVLTVGLLAVSVAAWVVVGLTSAAVAAAVIPTVLLVGVLALGRRAAVRGRAADAAWEQQQRLLQAGLARPASGSTRITGRALHPSDSHTEAVPHVTSQRRAEGAPAAADEAARPASTGSTAARGAAPAAGAPDATQAGDAGHPTTSADAGPEPSASAGTTGTTGTTGAPGAEASAAARPSASATDDQASAPAGDVERTVTDHADQAGGETGEGWSPVPVPRPTYTTKATAPRREPLPLVVDEPVVTPAAAAEPGAQGSEASATTPPAIDLDAVLARRRAVGE